MKIILKAIIILLLSVILVSCTNFTSTPAANPTVVNVIETPTALPTSTLPIEIQLLLTAPTDISNPTAVPSPAPDQQTYIDPHGWYAVFFPAEMEPVEKPNGFSWMGDFFQTGYLPEFG
ncbi:MAG TPA: hypothetical protein VJM08_02980 [Anaerolineales bacterium]|nr:hypothetical protein [Anaerolineales bacterium]